MRSRDEPPVAPALFASLSATASLEDFEVVASSA
jgi:hypothetical protein